MRIRYSREAVADLQRLREFIAAKSPPAASGVAALLLKGISQLRLFPRLGAKVGLAPDPERIRDLVVGKYVVRYLVGSDEIFVLRVWHHREDRIGE